MQRAWNIGGRNCAGQRGQCKPAAQVDGGTRCHGTESASACGVCRTGGALSGVFAGGDHAHRAKSARDPNRSAARKCGSEDRVAGRGGGGMRGVAARLAEMIRTEAVWMSVVPIDMRAGTDTLLARIVLVFGEARPHHAYLFANQRGTRPAANVCNSVPGYWPQAAVPAAGHFIPAAGHFVPPVPRGFPSVRLTFTFRHRHSAAARTQAAPSARVCCPGCASGVFPARRAVSRRRRAGRCRAGGRPANRGWRA